MSANMIRLIRGSPARSWPWLTELRQEREAGEVVRPARGDGPAAHAIHTESWPTRGRRGPPADARCR